MKLIRLAPAGVKKMTDEKLAEELSRISTARPIPGSRYELTVKHDVELIRREINRRRAAQQPASDGGEGSA